MPECESPQECKSALQYGIKQNKERSLKGQEDEEGMDLEAFVCRRNRIGFRSFCVSME